MNDQPLTPVATRIALVLRRGSLPWQSVNVAAFLASGITEAALEGEDYVDADGTTYLPLLAQPVMIHEGDLEELASVRARAVERVCASRCTSAGCSTRGTMLRIVPSSRRSRAPSSIS